MYHPNQYASQGKSQSLQRAQNQRTANNSLNRAAVQSGISSQQVAKNSFAQSQQNINLVNQAVPSSRKSQKNMIKVMNPVSTSQTRFHNRKTSMPQQFLQAGQSPQFYDPVQRQHNNSSQQHNQRGHASIMNKNGGAYNIVQGSLNNSGRPGSKNLPRKEKVKGQFGRTFFHPPSVGDTGQAFQSNGSLPTQDQFNQTSVNLSQIYMSQGQNPPTHHRSGTQAFPQGNGQLKQMKAGKLNQFDSRQNKFSQPTLPASYGNQSVERLTTNGTQASIGALPSSQQKNRQHFQLNQQQQAHLKANLQKSQAQVEALFKNQNYSMQKAARKQSYNRGNNKSSANRDAITIPNSFQSTGSMRVPSGKDSHHQYQTSGGLSQSLVNGHHQMFLNEQSQSSLQNNNQGQDVYATNKFIDRLFSGGVPQGANHSNTAAILPRSQGAGSTKKKPNKSMQLTNQGLLMSNGSATQIVKTQSAYNIGENQTQAQSNNYAGKAVDAVHRGSNSVAHVDSKTVKNNFYLQQHLAQRGKSNLKISSAALEEERPSQQHRKNNSMVVKRGEILGSDGKIITSKFLTDAGSAVSSIAGTQKNAKSKRKIISQAMQHPTILGVPENMSPDRVLRIGSRSQLQRILPDQDSPESHIYQQSNSNPVNLTAHTKKKASAQEKRGAMTPQTDTQEKTISSAYPSVKNYSQSTQPAASHQAYQQSAPKNKGVSMIQDGGTGTTLKRVFVGQESNHTSEAASQSNYGSQQYALPIKQAKKIVVNKNTIKLPVELPNDLKEIRVDEEEQEVELIPSKAPVRKNKFISINITEEALRIGKLPCETIAENIVQGKYNKDGVFKDPKLRSAAVSPRVQEMVYLSNLIRQSFKKGGEPETTTEFYRAGKMLGRGAFGKVNLGMHKLTRKLIAIKSINKEYLSEEKQRTKIMHEVGILLKLRHPSVVKLYETFETRRHIMLVMELCAGGDLLNFVRKRKKLDEPLAKVIFKQVIEGIGYIHSKRILHRDIKLDNILLDGKGQVKIADFGVSKSVKKGEIMYEQSGTPAYIAPEIIRDKGYKGFKADMWSAGVVLFALLFGTVPFKANNMKDLHQQIMTAKYNLKDEITEPAKELIRGLLNIDPQQRLGVSQVLKHPWMQGVEAYDQDIFHEAEKEIIRGEFTYNDPSRYNRNEKVRLDEEPWDCFTELNLDSANQTLRNASEKSQILAPFNSTMSDVDKFFKSVLSMAPMENRKEIIKFHARCRDQDRQYEINNNAELDNGVYHKFVYSSKDDNSAKGRDRQDMLSRNSSKAILSNTKNKKLKLGTQEDHESSLDLSKAQDKKKSTDKVSLQAEREALKASIKGISVKNKANNYDSSDEDYEIYETHASQKTTSINQDSAQILVNFGYPADYLTRCLQDNEANYCVAGYYLLAIDQNY